MRSWFTVRRLSTIVGLVLAWCALWGEVSVANLASGTALAIVVSGTPIGTPGRGGIRLLPLMQFGYRVAIDLVVSTYSVARETLTPTDRTDEAIIAVAVPPEARKHLLLLVVAITLTPGTAVVDADPDTGTIYLHLLHAERRDATSAHVVDLATLACAALPTPQPLPLVE